MAWTIDNQIVNFNGLILLAAARAFRCRPMVNWDGPLTEGQGILSNKYATPGYRNKLTYGNSETHQSNYSAVKSGA